MTGCHHRNRNASSVSLLSYGLLEGIYSAEGKLCLCFLSQVKAYLKEEKDCSFCELNESWSAQGNCWSLEGGRIWANWHLAVGGRRAPLGVRACWNQKSCPRSVSEMTEIKNFPSNTKEAMRNFFCPGSYWISRLKRKAGGNKPLCKHTLDRWKIWFSGLFIWYISSRRSEFSSFKVFLFVCF